MPDMPPSAMSVLAPHEPSACPAPQLDSDDPVVPVVDVVVELVVGSACVALGPPHALTPRAAAAANQIFVRISIAPSPHELNSYRTSERPRRASQRRRACCDGVRHTHSASAGDGARLDANSAMPHHVSLALGVAFVLLAVAAVLLQAWLWNPKYWDPVAKKSHAPPAWMRVHRVVGYLYAGTYVVMMVHMVPRLWGYAVELPARTVVHMVAAIVIGVLLLTKIAILRWFRHFEEAMPALGLGLLVSTVVLASMSIPLGFRAYTGLDLTDAERARIERILDTLDFGTRTDAHALADPAALAEGREVVTRRCTQCHDLRSILSEPRTGPTWLALVRRMADKPGITRPLTAHEVMHVTSYLIAITPDLQRDAASRYAATRAATVDVDAPTIAASPDAGAVEAPVDLDAGAPLDAAAPPDAGPPPRRVRRPRHDAGVAVQDSADSGLEPAIPSEPSEPSETSETSSPPSTGSPETRLSGAALLASRCMDCHGEDELDAHGPDDRAGWSAVLRRMVGRGADLDAAELSTLAAFLAATRGS